LRRIVFETAIVQILQQQILDNRYMCNLTIQEYIYKH